MPLQTSAESPVPVRTVARAIAGWVGRLGRIWVEGQVTELSRRGGGTVFLTLRDPAADVSLRVTCGRQVCDAVDPPLTEGARIVVWARPEVYLTRGTLSLAAFEIRPVGLGALLARLEALKKVLAGEGLFAPERKKPLPFLPGLVGLVTGRDSAAERDVKENARRRWPAVRFRTVNIAVQGPGAVTDIVGALRRLDADDDVDVIVLARGGGSVEDLLPFSDETLCRAVAACATPVVAAIGHDSDTPLVDFVADRRASTPTDAGKLIVPDVVEELGRVAAARDRIRRSVDRHLAAAADGVVATRERNRRTVVHRLDAAERELVHARARVRSLSPAATLARGYAVLQTAAGAAVRSADEVAVDDELTARLAAGRLDVRVTGRTTG